MSWPRSSFASPGRSQRTNDRSRSCLGDKKQLTLPRYLPQEKENQYKYLVFCDVFKGAVDPYRGVAVKADSRIAQYLKGALAVKDKDTAARLRYFFDYLDDSDVEVC